MAPSKEGKHGEKCDDSGGKRHQDDESRKKTFSDQRKSIYLVNNIFEAWENAKIEADINVAVTVILPRISLNIK